jgi:hypothetical protein
MRFLDQHQLHDRCVTLHTPADFSDLAKVRAMFDSLGLVARAPLRLRGRKNRSLGYSSVEAAEEERQFAQVLEHLPQCYLDIFSRPPYTDFAWRRRFFLKPELQLQRCA